MHSGDEFGKDTVQHTTRSRLQPEALVPKKLQFVQQGQFTADFKCLLNSDNLNKAAVKPCALEQKSKGSR